MNKLILLSLLATGLSAYAVKPADLPECAKPVAACKQAHFKRGDHKVNGKGLWIDCIAARAEGKTVAGVDISQGDAQACHAAAKAARHH
jgi:hypothetical protein